MWTSDDFNVCVNLVSKARQHGVYDAVIERVKQLEEQSFPMASTSMTDAPKRRCEYDPPREKVATYSSMPEDDVPTTSVPMPKCGMMPSIYTESEEISSLPPGISSVEHWGRSLVSFGKYENKKTYHEIAFNNSEDIKGYRAYLFGHFESESARLRDLVLYMKAAGFDPDRRCKIPGTSINRKFA